MNRDLTVGDPGKVLWQFCLPLFGSIIFQQLYNIADSLVAGRFIGENALAAVGNSYEITLIYIAFAFGCNVGCSVITSRLFGAKNYSAMKTAVSTAMISSGVLCALLMVVGLATGSGMLAGIHTPAEILADSVLYLDIYIKGLPFLFFYNIATGIFSALGDSKTPFLFLVVSSTGNIAVDILFVTAFKMGVAGVAWATFLCQGISCCAALFVVLRRLKKIATPEGYERFSLSLLGQFAAVAIPTILQQSFISIGNIIIQGVINGFGPSVIAGYAAAVKLNNMVIMALTTIGNGISNYTAQNMGAGKPERVYQGFWAGAKMVWSLCVPITVLYFFGSRWLLLLFLEEPTGLAVRTGVIFLRILAPFYCVIAVKLVGDGIMKGSEMMRRFMVVTFTDLILRVVLAVVLAKTSLGATGIWCSWPVGWCGGAVLSMIFCWTGPFKNKNK